MQDDVAAQGLRSESPDSLSSQAPLGRETQSSIAAANQDANRTATSDTLKRMLYLPPWSNDTIIAGVAFALTALLFYPVLRSIGMDEWEPLRNYSDYCKAIHAAEHLASHHESVLMEFPSVKLLCANLNIIFLLKTIALWVVYILFIIALLFQSIMFVLAVWIVYSSIKDRGKDPLAWVEEDSGTEESDAGSDVEKPDT